MVDPGPQAAEPDDQPAQIRDLINPMDEEIGALRRWTGGGDVGKGGGEILDSSTANLPRDFVDDSGKPTGGLGGFVDDFGGHADGFGEIVAGCHGSTDHPGSGIVVSRRSLHRGGESGGFVFTTTKNPTPEQEDSSPIALGGGILRQGAG